MQATQLHVNYGAAVAIIHVKGSLVEVALQLEDGESLFELAPMLSDGQNIDQHFLGKLDRVWINGAHVNHALQMKTVIAGVVNGG